MLISAKSKLKIVAIAERIGLTLGLVAATAVIAQSQSPGVNERAATLPSPGPGVSVAQPLAKLPNVGVSGDMIGFSHSDSSGTQTITLVDCKKSWMAVYHIDKSGTLRLVSSRPIDSDFSLQFNATSPLPEEIRQIGRR